MGILPVDVALRAGCHHLQGRITDHDRKPKRQIQHAALAAVLEARACQADVGALLPGSAVGLPAEDCEGPGADLAFLASGQRKSAVSEGESTYSAMVFLEHLHVRVVGQAFLAH